MSWTREIVGFGTAAALVAAVALGIGTGPAHAQDKPPKDEREIKPKKGPYFEIAMNSMDLVRTNATVVSCLDYRCGAQLPVLLSPRDTKFPVYDYQLTRIVHRGPVFLTDCDEIFDVFNVFAEPEPVELSGALVQTRWMRMDQPVGFFVGRLSVAARVAFDGQPPFVEIFRAELSGTTGFRTSAGIDAAVLERCSAPYYDQGAYAGRFSRKGLRQLLAQFTDVPDTFNVGAFLRKFPRCRVAGTFQGDNFANSRNGADYCTIFGGVFCFDGVMRCTCKPDDIPDPRDPPIIFKR